MAEDAPAPAARLDLAGLAKLPPVLQGGLLLLSITGSGGALALLGIQQQDPPASRAEVVEIQKQIRMLERAVDRLSYVVESNHTAPPRPTP